MSYPVALPPRIPLTTRQRLRARVAAAVATRTGKNFERAVKRALRKARRPATLQETEHAVAAVTTASIGLGGITACLPRSLAALLYCQAAYRSAPALVIGVRPGTSLVHAWVEAEGRPAGEPSDPRREYAPVRIYRLQETRP